MEDSRRRLGDDREQATRTLATMWRIRRFEEAVDDLFARGMMHGTMHLSIGQEASATGACFALRPATRSPPPTAGTATASPRARTSRA
jgi:TPP-dependent pyruvate/acetoin dehydrogenase alpha subunit